MTALSSLVVLALCASPDSPAGTVLLQFSLPQCPNCKAVEPTVSRLTAAGCPVQTIDVEQQPEVAKQFQLTGVPTFVLLQGGRETGRVVGAASYEQLEGLWKAVGPSTAPSHANVGDQPVQAAVAATVRLRVEDASGYGFGTGTIIDTHDGEALVVTCGHLFRDSQGKGKISADVFASGTAQSVEGQLIAYDLDRDIALVSLRVPFSIPPVQVAPPGLTVRPQDRAFTIGCDKGADPSVRQTQITAVNKYRGKPNYTAAGQPVDGRSGGGLFTADGLLIGVCNAADPADNEGLYAGLASIHWQLDQIGQSAVYQRAAQRAVAVVAERESAVRPAASQSTPSETSVPQLPARMPPSALAGLSETAAPRSWPGAAPTMARELEPAVAADSDAEIVFIVRSKHDPQKRSEVYVVDQASADLLARISSAARATGEQRAALAQTRATGPVASRPNGLEPTAAAQPIVRGQSSDY
jgi:thiol-disulfide isomerase/thioredoxin